MFMIVDSDNWVKQNRKQAIQSDAGSCRLGASEVSAWCDRVSLSSLRSYHCQRENWTRTLSPRGMHWPCVYLWFWHVTWQHGLTIQTLLLSMLKWLKEGWRLVTSRQYRQKCGQVSVVPSLGGFQDSHGLTHFWMQWWPRAMPTAYGSVSYRCAEAHPIQFVGKVLSQSPCFPIFRWHLVLHVKALLWELCQGNSCLR